jgi:hypothetical protein
VLAKTFQTCFSVGVYSVKDAREDALAHIACRSATAGDAQAHFTSLIITSRGVQPIDFLHISPYVT